MVVGNENRDNLNYVTDSVECESMINILFMIYKERLKDMQ